MAEANTDWIEWAGGECPVAPTTKVQVRMRDGATEKVENAAYWCAVLLDRDYWVNEPSDHNNDIVAYRIVPTCAIEASDYTEAEAACKAALARFNANRGKSDVAA